MIYRTNPMKTRRKANCTLYSKYNNYVDIFGLCVNLSPHVHSNGRRIPTELEEARSSVLCSTNWTELLLYNYWYHIGLQLQL